MVKIVVSLSVALLCCIVLLVWCATREKTVRVQLVLPTDTGEFRKGVLERHKAALEAFESSRADEKEFRAVEEMRAKAVANRR